MFKSVLKVRNGVNKFFYKKFLKPVFFNLDPEFIHDRMTSAGKFLGSNVLGRMFLKSAFYLEKPELWQNVCGIRFHSPVGLAAGFDKNAELVEVLPYLGFGFAELGSITGSPCAGNAKPRLWRLKKSESLVVNYGLKNDGAEVIAYRLKNTLPKVRNRKAGKRFVFGISIAKTNCQETCERATAVEDYYKAYKLLQEHADYITVNISCPNAFGGQPFTDAESLDVLLAKLDELYKKTKPVFVKLSPDLSFDQIDQIIEVCARHKVDGYVCTNLTKKREDLKVVESEKSKVPNVGGISGKVVKGMSDDLIAHIYKKTAGKKVIVGVGGIFSAEDAYAKIRLGANLVQLVTGMIFEGPSLISEINLGLMKLLERDGFTNIAEVVGVDSKISDK